MVDVRGNSGGDACLIYDLAYLLSNHLNSPQVTREPGDTSVTSLCLLGRGVITGPVCVASRSF